MGYDLKRFIGKIEEDFHCTICRMVLENPVQTTCNHIFCDNCIQLWLAINSTCPVDRRPLSVTGLKPIDASFRNLWNKLEVNCTFHSEGCITIIKLEHLENHCRSCKYNQNAEFICDKGCNLKITRREYEMNNCFAHLANKMAHQEDTILKLRLHLSDQKHHFDRTINLLQEQITQLNDQVNHEEVQLKWQVCSKIKISFDQPNILEVLGDSSSGLAQSLYSLDSAKPCFKVQILYGVSMIGLTRKERTTTIGFRHMSLGYSSGRVWVDADDESIGPNWKNGDIIECGIKFPNNFINDGSMYVEVYFSFNKKLVTRKLYQMPRDGLFPTCYMTRYAKLKYFNN